MSRGARLLIYAQDGHGLGHLRRASSIAAEFLRGDELGSVLTISDSPIGTLLHDLPNHDHLKLPSIVKDGPGCWRPLSLPLDFSAVHQLRSRVLLETVKGFQPDVLLVDHMPHGAMGELIPALESLQGRSTRIVLGLRDIIDAPEVVQERWAVEGAIDVVEQHYDQVLVYGSRDVFDVAREYGWSPAVARLVRYCGYVCMPEEPQHAKRTRNRRLADVPDGQLVVAMAGGGADAYELMSNLLDAFPRVDAEHPCAFVLVTGPFMPEHQRQDLKLRAEGQRIRVRTTVRDPLSYVAAADLVVAMAGYNTTTEILRVGTPALLVPRRGPSREQRMRAQRFAERGWATQIDPDDLTPCRLADTISALLGRSDQPAPKPDLCGLELAVSYLRDDIVATTTNGIAANGKAPTANGEAPTAHATR